MKIIIIIILILLSLVVLYHIFCSIKSKFLLKKYFKSNNVIVFGKKGKGKDLLFQEVINLRNKEYYSNISYGGKFNKAIAKDLELASNNYESFIKGEVEIIDKSLWPYEKKDFYFSDVGVHLPSQYDSFLHKTYKGFPIAYALSRHLWANNIHCNTQALNRVWLALREQADTYIKCVSTTKSFFLGFLRLDFIIYDKYESARQDLRPVPNRVFNGFSKAEQDIFKASNGYIEQRFLYIPIRKIKYDTRAYHEIIFGKKFVSRKRRRSLKKRM